MSVEWRSLCENVSRTGVRNPTPGIAVHRSPKALEPQLLKVGLLTHLLQTLGCGGASDVGQSGFLRRPTCAARISKNPGITIWTKLVRTVSPTGCLEDMAARARPGLQSRETPWNNDGVQQRNPGSRFSDASSSVLVRQSSFRCLAAHVYKARICIEDRRQKGEAENGGHCGLNPQLLVKPKLQVHTAALVSRGLRQLGPMSGSTNARIIFVERSETSGFWSIKDPFRH